MMMLKIAHTAVLVSVCLIKVDNKIIKKVLIIENNNSSCPINANIHHKKYAISYKFNSLRSNHNLFLALLGSDGIHLTGLHNQDTTKATVFL